MAAPTNTYNSLTDLGLGQVPMVDDPILYEELLDIHNAIEKLLTSSDAGDTRAENVRLIGTDSLLSSSDNVVLLDAVNNSVALTLLTAVDFTGYRFSLKCIGDTFPCIILAEGAELLEGEPTFELFEGEYIDIVSDGINWRVA